MCFIFGSITYCANTHRTRERERAVRMPIFGGAQNSKFFSDNNNITLFITYFVVTRICWLSFRHIHESQIAASHTCGLTTATLNGFRLKKKKELHGFFFYMENSLLYINCLSSFMKMLHLTRGCPTKKLQFFFFLLFW